MYLALARKYRPQRFEDLIGQPHITKTLQNAISQNKLYPALIFSGMKGVGKTSSARILSKTLNCEKGPDIEPCNECATCIEITDDKSPDYIEIDGASNNGVEEVRQLKEKVKYKPFKNKFRVVVIDEVHMLSNSAWNALLKTIEEPPDHTYFVMATTDFHKIPATIVSRCQQFEFKRIPYEIITKLLKEICEKEGIKITDYGLFLVSRASDGSLRDAKKILDQAIAISNGDVKDNDVIDILGVIEEEIFIALTKDMLTGNRKGIIQQINDLAERGMDLRFFYNEYLKFFRDLMVLKSLGESEKLYSLNPENIPQLNEMLRDVREVELLRYFNAAKDLEQTMRNTENPRIILEYLFLKLSYFPSLMSIEELIDKAGSVSIHTAEPVHAAPGPTMAQSLGTTPVGERQSSGARPSGSTGSRSASAPKTNEDIRARVIEAIRKENPRMASALGDTTFALENDSLSISFPADLEFAYKNMDTKMDFLKGIVQKVMNKEIAITLKMDEKSANEATNRANELENDKKVKGLADKIKGQIVSIEKM
jgi:DNA polymerase-3 subunit gamma/tau